MIKIRDNVDLKELKKFGFKKGYSILYMSNIYGYIDNSRRMFITTRPWWDCEFYYLCRNGEDTLYDLIKADLVEKV